MTVSTFNNTVVYRGNGSATAFAVPFKVLDEDHFIVTRRIYETGVEDHTYIGTDYSYSGIGDSSGTLTLAGAALSSTYELIIERIVPYAQDLDIVNAGGFYPESVEEQLDLIVMQIQQLAKEVERTVRVMPGSDLPELGTSPARDNKIIGFDDDGDLTLFDSSAFKGDPGANVESIGLFTAAAGMEIATGTETVRTSGYSTLGKGAARYVYDAAVNAAYVTSNPRSSFIAGDDRGFRLEVSDGQVHVDQTGSEGDGVLGGGIYTGTDDTAAFRAAIALGTTILAGPRAYMLHDILDVLTLGPGQELCGSGKGGITKLCKRPLLISETQVIARSFIRNNGGRVRNLDIYIQKSGVGRNSNQRMNAVLYTGTGPMAENVNVYDVTGYGHFAAGMVGGYAKNVSATNCDVLFEAINGTGFTFKDFEWAEGDGDCGSNTVIEIYRNATLTSGITLRNGLGEVMNGAMVKIGLTNGAVSDLTFDNVVLETPAALNAFSVSDGNGSDRRLDGLRIVNSSFSSVGGVGGDIQYTDDVRMWSTKFSGTTGLTFSATCTDIRIFDGTVTGTSFQGLNVSTPSDEVFFDGEAIGVDAAIVGDVDISDSTKQTPAPGVPLGTPVAITNDANTTVTAIISDYYRVEKTGGGSPNGDAAAISAADLTGSFRIELVVRALPSSALLFGVSADPAAAVDDAIGAVFRVEDSGDMYAQGLAMGKFNIGQSLWMVREGDTVTFIAGGALPEFGRPLHSVTLSGAVGFDSLLYSTSTIFDVKVETF